MVVLVFSSIVRPRQSPASVCLVAAFIMASKQSTGDGVWLFRCSMYYARQ